MAESREEVVGLPWITGLRLLRGLAAWTQAFEARHLRNAAQRRLVKAGIDFLCGAVSALVAIAINGSGFTRDLLHFVAFAVVVGTSLVTADVLTGGYRTMWRYTSLPEAEVVAATSLVLLAGMIVAHSLGLLGLSIGSMLLLTLLVLFSCMGVRGLRRWQVVEAQRPARLAGAGAAPQRRLLIAGAGEHGLSIGRDLDRTMPGVVLVGFLDDDPAKLGAYLNRARVLGPLTAVLDIVEQYDVTEIIIAMPVANPERVRAFARHVEQAGIPVRAVRGVDRFVTGRDVHRPGSATLAELLESPGLPSRRRTPESASPRVLVTGGAGYIGSHLTRMLLDRGYRVRILDRFDYGRSGIEGLHHPLLEVLEGDICNVRDVSRAVRDVEAVLALAAIVGDPACNLDPEETTDLNYAATKVLIETANFYGVRRLVFASSCSVYGASSEALLTERSRLSPLSLYARTRVLSESVIFDRRGEVEPVVLRLATAFGVSPRMRFDLVVNTLTARAVVDGTITIFGGNQWRPNVHCRDAARAFVLALEAPSSAVAGEVFNVGGDALNHRIDEIGDLVSTAVGQVELVRQGDVTDARDYRVSFEKIRRALAFVPAISVREGILEVAAAVRRDATLRHHQRPVFHNVQALKHRLDPHAPVGAAAPTAAATATAATPELASG